MLPFGNTPQKEAEALAGRMKKLRKQQKLTQAQLARKAGLSLSSLKRFEQKGEIALLSLLKIAHVLGCLEDFSQAFTPPQEDNLSHLFSEDLQ